MPTLTAPAKINLTLEVLDRRADGYHGIRSLMVPLALADTIEATPADAFSFTCDDATLASDDNLVARAYRLVVPDAPRAIALHKSIPTQAGLGGGSSDAAAILIAAMNGAFGPQPQRDWLGLARELGSDVPFFLVQTGALVEGTGERVTAVGALPPWHVLIIKPPAAVSTADAYAALDAHPRPSRPRKDSASLLALDALQRGAFDEVTALLQNDFDAVVTAKHPEVARALAALRSAGAAKPMLAGSGACAFALTRTTDERDRIAASLDLQNDYARFATSFANADAWRGSVPA